MNLLTYSDGERDLLAIAELLDIPAWELAPLVNQLLEHGLLADEDKDNEG
jgi:aminopeptidase-like protein